MIFIENTFDKLNDKNKALENWIDIYMPLRIQHQITETVKDSLEPRGKYMLGVADQLMTNKFRERVFVDVGKPDLQEKCLSVIEALKLQADNLTEENKFAMRIAEREYDKWYQDKDGKQENNPLVTVDMSDHLGQQNKEMIDTLKQYLASYIDDKDKQTRDFV